MLKNIKVRVPGTTANCGPGFDAIGIALNLYNELELELLSEEGLEVIIEGEGAGILPTDQSNIAVKAINGVLDRVSKNYPGCLESSLKGLRIKMNNNIPLSHGLGSSAAAIVAGLTAANEITGAKLTKADILNLATELEGHPDNVAPAIFGGITVSIVEQNQAHCLNFSPAAKFSLVVGIPDFELSTQLAREALPPVVPFPDAVFNLSRAALLVGALCQGELDYLKYALQDKMHQPYREKLITGMADVLEAATAVGAFGAVLSGAGPCIIAFAPDDTHIKNNIGAEMVRAFAKYGIGSKYLALEIDNLGARVL